ncbi:hypothetical protein Q8A67_018388 [Cirrhinus molitorella]|uniref:Uncharacterized protein n=1 Tax=Cirrhinus molitorella TaxID=172907 RepID=A0AA88PC01_9TELE|nr:hypothetical protein Q8A67_018388 [Cirrhinus molitorella]
MVKAKVRTSRLELADKSRRGGEHADEKKPKGGVMALRMRDSTSSSQGHTTSKSCQSAGSQERRGLGQSEGGEQPEPMGEGQAEQPSPSLSLTLLNEAKQKRKKRLWKFGRKENGVVHQSRHPLTSSPPPASFSPPAVEEQPRGLQSCVSPTDLTRSVNILQASNPTRAQPAPSTSTPLPQTRASRQG